MSIAARVVGCRWLPISLIGAAILSYLAYIHVYGVNVLYWDEWVMVPIYRQFVGGTLNLWALFKNPHNENLMFFPYSLMLCMDFVTGFNDKIGMYLGALFQIASLALLWLLAKDYLPDGEARTWYAVPLACILFSLSQNKNILWGFQTAWFMVTFFR